MTLFGAALLFWLLPTLTFLVIAVIVYPMTVLARRFRQPDRRPSVAMTGAVARSIDA